VTLANKKSRQTKSSNAHSAKKLCATIVEAVPVSVRHPRTVRQAAQVISSDSIEPAGRLGNRCLSLRGTSPRQVNARGLNSRFPGFDVSSTGCAPAFMSGTKGDVEVKHDQRQYQLATFLS
jgi:hypothetical protein